ncbi:MAG: hypothetical protein LIR50_08680 [Bacillota bacterium]|nr:hypothetical protein [Bacillota bacterium]
MKKNRLIIYSVIILITFITLGKFKEKSDYKINIPDKKISAKVLVKGTDGALDFTEDDSGNIYIGYKDYIQYVGEKGNSFIILKDESLNISSIDCYKDMLYFTSDSNLISYNIKDKKLKVLINNFPNLGDYNRSNIKINKGRIYITIGAATNSGVVGDDNLWKSRYPYFCDISPRDLTLTGVNFGVNKQGAFMMENSRSSKEQQISAHRPGNSEIISYDIETGKIEDYADGIRNVTGFDFNSEGNLIAGVGGMEYRGLRPVFGDKDYIYRIDKGVWYGFPDFSGGDDIQSPRFNVNGTNKNLFILEKHPSSNPPAPIYQHKSLSTLGCLAIDTEGKLGYKDDIYFYDKEDNTIYKLNNLFILSKYIVLNKASDISSIKFYKGNLLVMDRGRGVIYKIIKK